MTTVRDRADLLLADLLQIIGNRFTNTLRLQLLARLRDELEEAKQEGFREAMEMRHDENR
jgi:hypothetical protein